MTHRLSSAGRAPRTLARPGLAAAVLARVLAAAVLALGLAACSSDGDEGRTGNLRVTVRLLPAPDDVELGAIDTLFVDMTDASGDPVDSTIVLAPAPALSGGEMTADLLVSSAAGLTMTVRAVGDRPVIGGATASTGHGVLWRGESAPFDVNAGGANVAMVIAAPFVPGFEAVEFLDDGARHRVRWNRNAGAVRWRLSIQTGGAPRDTLLSDTLFTASVLPAVYQVRALDVDQAAGAPGDRLQPGILLPNPPTNLRVTPRTGERIDVRWNPGGGAVRTWEIERRGEEEAFVPRASIDVDTTLYADTTVIDGRRWEYRIRARNTHGVSAWSGVVAGFASLNAPATVTATLNDLEIALGWQDRSLSENGYQVERAAGIGGFQPIRSLPINAMGWIDAPLAENTRYRYRVRAVRGENVSAWSAVAEATTPLHIPSSPAGLLAQPISPMQINLGWGPARGIVAAYEIERRRPGQTFAGRDTVGGDIIVFADLGLPPATTYEYRVRAVNVAGSGAWSNTASATTHP